MSFVIVQTGQLLTLQSLINSSVLQLHLFSNDRVPSVTDTVANYTEVNVAGYAPKLLTPGAWVYSIDGLTNDYMATFPMQTWTFNVNVTAFGYYITDNSNALLILAERFLNAPVALTGVGSTIQVTPTIEAS